MKLTRDDVFKITNTLVAVLGFLLIFGQVRMATSEFTHSQLLLRAQVLPQLHQRLFGSPRMMNVMQKIEYRELKYDENFHNSEDQKAILEVLAFFEYMGQLEELGLLEMSDIASLFGYHIIRVHENEAVRGYRELLSAWGRRSGLAIGGINYPNFERLATTIQAELLSGARK